MKNKQKGLSLIGLLFWGVFLVLTAIVIAKLTPEYITYYKILQGVKAIAADSAGKTPAELRQDFSKRMLVDHVETIEPSDLVITKEGGAVNISFAYESQVPLVYNISFLLDFQGSAQGRP